MDRSALLAGITLVWVGVAVGRADVARPPTTRPGVTVPQAEEKVRRDLVVKDIDGVARRPLNGAAGKGAVLFFLSHDCPISNGYAPEVNRICAAYGGADGFTFTIVHPYAELSSAQAKKHAKDYGYTVPVVVDAERALTRQAKPMVTPEVVVVGPEGAVLYRGRIDDKWSDYGKARPEPTRRELRDALDAIRAGKPVPVARTEAVGCPV